MTVSQMINLLKYFEKHYGEDIQVVLARRRKNEITTDENLPLLRREILPDFTEAKGLRKPCLPSEKTRGKNATLSA